MLELDPATIPPPTATGTLEERPLAHLLAYALQNGLTGTFELADDPRQYALVSVAQGGVARVWTSEPVSYLGHVLYESGAITDVQLGASLAELAATKSLQGQLLLAKKIIDAGQLATALHQQRLRKLHHTLMFPPTARFSFYAEVDLVGARPDDVGPCDPLPSIWRGIVVQPSLGHVRTTVAAIGGRALRLAGSLDVDAFQGPERAALLALRSQPATLAELAELPGFDARLAELLAYFLAVAKQVELTEPVRASAPVSSRSMDGGGRRIALGPEDAPPSSVRGLTPPPGSVRYPAPPSSRSPSIPPFARFQPTPSRSASAAPPPPPSSPSSAPSSAPVSSGSLAPPPSSARGVAAPTSRTAPTAVKNPAAEQALAQAEMHFILNDRHQALSSVREALELAPKMPSALALLAALEATNVRQGQEDKLRDILKRLTYILAGDPTCRRGNYYRARIRKRLDDMEGALEDLQKAAELDPEDADVRRELRLAERQKPAAKSGSILDAFRRR